MPRNVDSNRPASATKQPLSYPSNPIVPSLPWQAPSGTSKLLSLNTIEPNPSNFISPTRDPGHLGYDAHNVLRLAENEIAASPCRQNDIR